MLVETIFVQYIYVHMNEYTEGFMCSSEWLLGKYVGGVVYVKTLKFWVINNLEFICLYRKPLLVQSFKVKYGLL